jgi:hypothetical protein
MSSINAINNALHRNIKNGNQYNKYFSYAACKSSMVGHGDTTYTLELMAKGVVEYQHQTKKIATILQQGSVPETVENIYNFLYNHLQYSADGYQQDLRTPDCSWSSRKLGIDCKSYSVFAGCILYNLNIPFKFRKITQASSPDVFSHVYVVVDYKNTELIIDATKQVNVEPNYIQKFDMAVNLPHNWLNGPEQETITERDAVMIDAVTNFKQKLVILENKGVSKEVTARILDEVKKNLINGVDPYIETFNGGISINGVSISFGLQGLGFLDPATLGTITSLFSSGSFSELFSGIGRSPDSKGITHIVEPMRSHIEQKLAASSERNAHSIATELDMLLNATISHETKVNSRFSAVALPELKKMLATLREQFSMLSSVSKTGNSSSGFFPDFWYGGNDAMAHVGTFSYNQYSAYVGNTYTTPALPINTNTPYTGSNSGSSFIDSLVKVGNLFLDPQTDQTYTPEQVRTISAQTGQTIYSGNNNQDTEDSGMSTGAMVAIGVGALAVVGTGVYLATKK